MLLLCWSVTAYAGPLGGTGDAEWDAILAELNAVVGSERANCARDIDLRYGVPAGTSARLMKRPGFSVGDACMALKLSIFSHRPLDDIVNLYEADRGKGWGVVAKSLGIKPGSKEFHELKNDSKSFLKETKKKGKHKGKDKDKDKVKAKAKDKGKDKDQDKDKGQSKAGKGK